MTVPTTPGELFRRAGVALYGEEFVHALSRQLGAERSTIRKWMDGRSRIPAGVWGEVLTALEERLKLTVSVLDDIGSTRPHV